MCFFVYCLSSLECKLLTDTNLDAHWWIPPLIRFPRETGLIDYIYIYIGNDIDTNIDIYIKPEWSK